MISTVKLLRRETIARETMAFYFQKPEGFSFRAGQFADYTLIDPPENDAEGSTRGFSLVHAPFEDDLVAATRLRETAFKRVLRHLPIGTEVKLDAPYGDFSLHKTQTTPAVFIIGGIGVTPVRSMIAQATHDKTAHKITLLHANRTPADAPFVVDFKRFSEENMNFSFVPVFTDEGSKHWGGEHGLVDAEMIKRHLPDLKTPIYYLSGPAGMVKAMRQLLIELNVNEDRIRTEEFAGY
jgi:ferredoxin-NADP reductase